MMGKKIRIGRIAGPPPSRQASGLMLIVPVPPGRHLTVFPDAMNFNRHLPDDASVIRNILQGDINSFEILLDRYQDHVARVVRNHVPGEEAPGVAHDAFVQAYQSLGGFKGTGPFKHWLSKIAVRCCHDFWRSYYHRQANRVEPLPDDCRDWVDHLVSVESSQRDAEQVEARNLLQWALGQLSAAERTVLTLTYLNEYSVAEAAELLEWSVIRTKVQAHRARKKLRKILAKILPEGIA